MAGSDAEVFNFLERAVSSDLNDLQSIATRLLSELTRYAQQVRITGVIAEGPVSVVFGGLTVVPNGANVDMQAGFLGQISPTLAPVPGPLDSTFRLARTDAAITVAMPVPGVDTYYLIEAQMQEVVSLTASRDIYNPGTGFFAPALVDKQVRHTLVTQVVPGAGGQAPAPSGGDWIPIAIVRRPAGGGPVLATDIDDVRPVAESGRQRPPLPVVESGALRAADGSSLLTTIRSEMDGAFGKRCYDLLVGTVDPTAVQIIQPGLLLAGDTWYYLYLCGWSAFHLRPRSAALAGLVREGVLVLSDVPPLTTRTNSAPIPLPAPYGGAGNAPAGTGYCVAALRRNPANTGWYAIFSDDLKHFRLGGGPIAPPTVRAIAPIVAGANLVVPIAGSLPAAYRAARLRVSYVGASPTAAYIPANVRNLSIRDATSTIFLDSGFVIALETAASAPTTADATIPKQLGTDTFDLFVGGAAVDPGTSASIGLVGFDL